LVAINYPLNRKTVGRAGHEVLSAELDGLRPDHITILGYLRADSRAGGALKKARPDNLAISGSLTILDVVSSF